jgi:hypothetical protein
MRKIDPLLWSLTTGTVWAVICAIMALLAVFGYGTAFVAVIGSLYPGYSPGAFGAVLGLVYGFISIFIIVYLAILLHNRLIDVLR